MLKIDSLVKLIRAPKPASSSDLRKALDDIDIPAAEAAVDRLEAERQRLLLANAPDAELDAIEVKIKTANRDVEKLGAAKTELTRLIAEAEEREAQEQLEQRAAGARQAEQQLCKNYSEIDELAQQLRARLGEATVAAGTLAKWNRTAERAAPDRRIAYLDPVAKRQHLLGLFR